MKNENSINPHNSKRIKASNEVLKNSLIYQYNEGTALLQIPQEDTRIENVIKRSFSRMA